MIVNGAESAYKSHQRFIETPFFEFNYSEYSVSIASTREEKNQALGLRYDVFKRELGGCYDTAQEEFYESDRHDDHCFHLIVKHTLTNRVVGTYRFQSWEMAESGCGFYSSTQFDIHALPMPFLKQSIEIGRGCIHSDHRNGRVLYMLWKGLAASLIYMGKTTLFGCCSLFTQSQDEGLLLMNSLEEKKLVAEGLSVSANERFRCFPSGNYDTPAMVPELPILFQKYLDFGAKVCSEPAIDREFGTIDYLVMLHFHQMDQSAYRFFTRDILSQTG